MKNSENLERVEGVEDTQEVFENDIEMYLKMFCEQQNIKDLKAESQSVWNAALIYIKRNLFKDRSKLKLKGKLYNYNNNNYNNHYSNLNNSNCNAYDIDKVNIICDYYIYLCLMYDKEVSQLGFSNLTGISLDTLNEWGNNVNKLSKTGTEIYKKLNHFREESLSNKLATGNKNPVGILAILNRHYQWNLPGVSRENNKQQVLSVEQLPNLKQLESKENTDK